MARLTLDARLALLPASSIPLLYFAFAHVCLASACGLLLVEPSTAGTFFYHPRMVALVHLVTVGWISGSILGAFYIVGPLALRMPLRERASDRAAFAAFAAGTIGMSGAFWTGAYHLVAWLSALVMIAVLHVAVRAWRGLGGAVAPRPIKLHVALAFANMAVAGMFGAIVGMNRVSGWFAWSPLSLAYAHAHLAAIGWAVMMAVGLGYRLVPMVLPSRMPDGASTAISAVLLEAGAVILAVALVLESAWIVVGGFLAGGGIAAFLAHLRVMLRSRLPPPAELPRPDWPTWQTRAAFAWLIASAAIGVSLSMPQAAEAGARNGTRWIYGTAGLVGFLSQVVIGIQGRLLPLHGWYRAFQAAGLAQPARSAHSLGSPALAAAVFWTWTAGVPALAAGFASSAWWLVSAGSGLLLAGVVLNAARGWSIVRSASAA
ncbi:MAG: hypothetical protein HYU53_11040 [Acidobacteria bacterium]|nr:hypothetical protein [Acidobacteriota bacterium]